MIMIMKKKNTTVGSLLVLLLWIVGLQLMVVELALASPTPTPTPPTSSPVWPSAFSAEMSMSGFFVNPPIQARLYYDQNYQRQRIDWFDSSGDVATYLYLFDTAFPNSTTTTTTGDSEEPMIQHQQQRLQRQRHSRRAGGDNLTSSTIEGTHFVLASGNCFALPILPITQTIALLPEYALNLNKASYVGINNVTGKQQYSPHLPYNRSFNNNNNNNNNDYNKIPSHNRATNAIIGVFH